MNTLNIRQIEKSFDSMLAANIKSERNVQLNAYINTVAQLWKFQMIKAQKNWTTEESTQKC